VQASEQTNGRLVVNELPGLKSVARASAAPHREQRAGGIADRGTAARRQEHSDDALAASPPRPRAVASRWSTERAARSIASGSRPTRELSREAAARASLPTRLENRALRRVEGTTLEEHICGDSEAAASGSIR